MTHDQPDRNLLQNKDNGKVHKVISICCNIFLNIKKKCGLGQDPTLCELKIILCELSQDPILCEISQYSNQSELGPMQNWIKTYSM